MLVKADMVESILNEIKAAAKLADLDEIKTRVFGKQGILTQPLRALAQLSPEERQTQGEALNALKEAVQDALRERRHALEQEKWRTLMAKESLDVTVPGLHRDEGRLHPLMCAMEDALTIFESMGFDAVQGPEVENVYYNFTALNVPEHHPSRSTQDTFYFDDEHVLRTHTSNIQMRALRERPVPLRIVTAGRVYRSDDLDETHTPMFHQLEGLIVEKGVHFGHLKEMITTFLSLFFGRHVRLRFRPSFFPFTEPSAEVDVWWHTEHGPRWLEILGCGMVHPNVLRHANLDPASIQGCAWGIGLERLTMLKYGWNDIRLFYRNDQRWLRQAGMPAALAGHTERQGEGL